MNAKGKAPERERRDWTVILILLLLGFVLVMIAGEWAIRFAPLWRLDANMRSFIDPDSDFLTNQPVGYYEPLDPSILTQPPWLEVFLTPGAIFQTRTPARPANMTNTPLGTNTLTPTMVNSPTNTPTKVVLPTNTPVIVIPSPTKTSPFFPPPSPTSTPRPANTATPSPTAIPVDLQITKTDGVTSYVDSGSVTYTIVVTNAGSNGVTGATITDSFPTQITSASWTCVPSGGAICPANGSGNISHSVNLPAGSLLTYTVNAAIGSGVSGNMVNTASVSVPAGYTDIAPGNNSATDTDAFTPSADLQITKTDNATHYTAGSTASYTIVVSNPAGPNDMNGATVTDIFSTNPNLVYASITWSCSASGTAVCTANGSGDINDTVNLPVGSSITYSVSASVSASPSGDLVNTAIVTEPSGTVDTAPGNNSATDTDVLIIADPLPPNMGTVDNITYTLPSGSTLTLSINLTADGNTMDWDLVYYEFSLVSLPPPDTFDGIWLDWIIIEISDGSNWYTVFNWSDNIRDQNTNADYAILTLPPPPPNPEEMDQRPIPSSDLYNATGVAIDIDSIVPPGTYIYIRFSAPPGDTDGQAEIDAIEILP